jgi:thioredoxin reductase
MYDMAIIGGGAAATAAAFYAVEKQLNFVLIGETLGGKTGQGASRLRYEGGASVTRRYVRRGDREVAEVMPSLPAHQLVGLLVDDVLHGQRVHQDRVLNITPGVGFFAVETGKQGVIHTSTVIIATGAAPRTLDVPGAARLIDPRMDYSPTTYAQQVTGQRVAVIGDTRRAVLGVAELARTAAHVVWIVPHAPRVHTPLGGALQHHANVEIVVGAAIREVFGTNVIEEIVLGTSNAVRRIPVDRAFVDLGVVPNSAVVAGVVDTDAHGFIMVDEHNAASLPGVFAAGDVTTIGGEHALLSVGDGVRAAQSAYHRILIQELARAQHDGDNKMVER